jgi:hypothetical protein
VKRQTWDKEQFERLAQLRASGQLAEEQVRTYAKMISFHLSG